MAIIKSSPTLFLSLILICFAGSVAAQTITVDGSRSDWNFSGAPYHDQGYISRNAAHQGAFVWQDRDNDERTDFMGGGDPRVDLLEFMVRGDAENLYFLAQMDNLDVPTGMFTPLLMIAVDEDQIPGSGQPFFGGLDTTQTDTAAQWESLIVTRFGSGNSDCKIWQDGVFDPITRLDTGQTVLDTATNVIEIAVPWTALGSDGPPSGKYRFTVCVYLSDSVDDALPISTLPRVLDCITNYDDPGSIANTYDEVVDGFQNYYFDLYFDCLGEVYPPVLISEVLPIPSSGGAGGEFIEIYNASQDTQQLAGYRIGNEAYPKGPETMFAFPVGSWIGPGEARVVANDGDVFFSNYGITPDYAVTPGSSGALALSPDYAWGFSDTLNLADSGDEVLLFGESYQALDIVEWADSTPDWSALSGTTDSIPVGNSLYRISMCVDRDDIGADFSLDSSNGSPGLAEGLAAAFTQSDTMVSLSAATVNFTNISSGGISYTWNFGDGSTSTLADPAHTWTTADTFEVVLEAKAHYCLDWATSEVVVTPLTHLNSILTPTLLIYPNPAKDYFKILVPNGQQNQQVSVSILNEMGQRIREFVPSNLNSSRFPVHTLSSGMYFVEVRVDGRLKNVEKLWLR